MSFLRRDKNLGDDDRNQYTLARLHPNEETPPAPPAEEAPRSQQFSAPSYGQRNPVPAPAAAEAPAANATPAAPAAPAAPEDPIARYRQGATTVAKDTTFKGNLNSNGNLVIEGNFDGEVESQATIFIADTANVHASVRATDVIVAGALEGTVNASRRFHAMGSAQVSGEIHSAVLVVDESARVNCRFAMDGGQGGAR